MPRVRSLRTQTLSPNRDVSPSPPSPTFSETTNASVLNFGSNGPQKIITRSNLKASLQAYEDLLNRCAAYRAALLNMSRATAGFADAMQACASLKGPSYESGTRMQAASGLHHLMSNHFHVMAETLDKQFEKPLRQHLENYRTVVTERSNSYERALREKSNIIRQTEMGNMKRKGRNLQTFREALQILQRQVDELDELKAQHYQEIIEHEEEVWDFVQGKICLAVRSTMDIFDRFTAKASDPVIEPMLQSIPDPFDSYGPTPAEDKIFSILPPLSVIANAPSSSPSPMTASSPELESSDGIPSGKNSWSATSGGFFPDTSAAWADVAASPPSASGSLATSPVRSLSPPAVNMSIATSPPFAGRRHSFPVASTSGHHTRKSESKLRSVLSVIDESRARKNGDSEDSVTSPPSLVNGKAPDKPVPDVGVWGTLNFTLAEHAKGTAGEADMTPRSTLRIRAQSPTSPTSPDDTRTPHADRSRSPHSDDTAVPLTT